ncbi:hypothetical protein [Klebsiella pneumoniae]|nr:hypothetical protein [Klebsiella pneumoniae]HDU4120202.1 hypothetical protein [Klebsiella pneumoniae subsp. pneumoniae]EMB5964244.1 hypothetical protein [Klebsiella pneumoniae]HBQ2264362.1 hypothetical protein [Klebsiella pneumoniae]HBR3401538.1 hypothetical protein [Klebsiella pneumoniae]HCM6517408.1 hypothetical protein [Klebsiella pneumoniae]
MQARIADLKSRTVKLPQERFRYGDSDYDDVFVNGWMRTVLKPIAS